MREYAKLVQFGGAGPKIELPASSDTEFTAREIPDVISFAKNNQGRVTHLGQSCG